MLSPRRQLLLAIAVLTSSGVLLLVTSAALAAAGFPLRVAYEGRVVDGDGLPLSGSYGLTLTYFDPAGNRLFSEAMETVEVVDGRLELELGSGEARTSDAYGSLVAVFEVHPEVVFEVTIDGETQAPRVGILPAGHSLKTRLVAAGLRSANDGKPHWKHYETLGGATAVQAAVLAPADGPVVAKPSSPTFRSRPYTLPVVGPKLSRPVSDLPLAIQQPMQKDTEVNPPRHEALFDLAGNRFGSIAPRQDDALVAAIQAPTRMTPALNFQFEGISNVDGVLPPDTEGTVGPNHYIQVVNLSFAVYDKAGIQLAGPSSNNSLWAGFGGPCETDNSGDAIFLYDEAADRYVLSQFAVAGSHQSVCFAVSQTADPLGSYHLYEVVTPRFPDYYKVGVWPDPSNNAYFFGTNSGFQGQYDVFAVDRANMLAGAVTRPMQFFQNFVNLMMPADLDGYNSGGSGLGAPPSGSPGLFYTFRDGGEPYFSLPPSDSIDVWEFDVDWTTPANSTFALAKSIIPTPEGMTAFNWTVCGFFVSNCIPQPGTTQGIDSASWWPMQRLVYRNFAGSHEALVGTWTVDVLGTGDRAAPRWFELRDTGGGWTFHQEGTHSPDAIHRWMPSIAMDGSGNIALGYSRGDGSNFPSICYATREAGDPLGTLQAEAVMIAGTGSQTHSAARWGDYSSMEIDPADDCTFWYTTEYLTATGSAPWRTRVGNFTIPGCGGPPAPTFSVACTPSNLTIEHAANDFSTCTVTASNGYSGSVDLACSGQPADITCGFSPASLILPVDGAAASTLTVAVGGAQTGGNHLFDVEATDATITKTAVINVTVVPLGSNGPQDAVYNATYQAPACLSVGSSCDSLALVDGRDGKGPEPNQPNTLAGSCPDGASGTYHSDESNDRIVVRTIDLGNFSEGDTVEIEATVWAWSTGLADALDLYYAADAASPVWTYVATLLPPGGGAQALTAQYTLPVGALQAVRANFRYQGTQSTCSGGPYDDADDLVFAVEPPCGVDADCDDGLFCNGAETCDAGVCQAGSPPVLDDGVGCTDDTCDEVSDVVVNTVNDANCDNGLFCDGAETCNATLDCQAGTPPVLDDGVACTDDSCDEVNDVVVNATNNANCDNGLFCDGREVCDRTLDCQAGSDPCPGQSCDEGTDECVACTTDGECDDGLYCNGAETCGAGTCQAGMPPSLDDGVGCTDDTCDEINDIAVHTANDANCDNGLFCDGAEICNAINDCQAGTAPVCDDGLYCNGAETCNETIDSCEAGPPPPGTISNTTLAGPLTIQSCGTLIIGPSVTLSGQVLLSAPDGIVFVEPVTVADGAQLELRVAPPP